MGWQAYKNYMSSRVLQILYMRMSYGILLYISEWISSHAVLWPNWLLQTESSLHEVRRYYFRLSTLELVVNGFSKVNYFFPHRLTLGYNCSILITLITFVHRQLFRWNPFLLNEIISYQLSISWIYEGSRQNDTSSFSPLVNEDPWKWGNVSIFWDAT